MDQFKHDIAPNTFILLKEKSFKPGRYIPAVVVDVHRRKDGLISTLKLKTNEHKGVIERTIRDCFMTEHSYLMLTESAHKCTLQDLEESDSKTWELPVSHLLFNCIMDSGFDLNKWSPKRGNEQVFSTKEYVQQ